MAVQIEPIGILYTCFKEKFGIPRQPNLVKKAPGTLVFYPEFAREEAVRELTGFSHVWLIFLFHKAGGSRSGAWSPMVRPPRLGGNKKVGVFASRSPFRPNPIGMSCVALDSVETTGQGPVLHLSGVDILDRTPILDIKPYLPYSDVIPNARDGFADGPPKPGLGVVFSGKAQAQVMEKEKKIPDLKAVITGMLKNDPRPAYTGGGDTGRIYGIRVFDTDVKWRVEDGQAVVISLEKA
ncbi:MAG: tRNA (N6-threonylcarbamoyladenosine(37)-N6)-methyltransferase TrmO [Desulfobacterales bacterium]|nr:tRNA (N6-threonylcarbamoyladenosine(37)-N6)-methyltransferase TrmO [Desulfobacterales bacterium]